MISDLSPSLPNKKLSHSETHETPGVVRKNNYLSATLNKLTHQEAIYYLQKVQLRFFFVFFRKKSSRVQSVKRAGEECKRLTHTHSHTHKRV